MVVGYKGVNMNKIEKYLKQGNIEGAKKNLRLLMEQEHKAEWDKKMEEEYYTLFPKYREMTDEEKDIHYNEYTFNPDVNEENKIPFEEYGFEKVEIDYSNDETYMTPEEYKNETKTFVVGTETVTDDNGVEYEKEIFQTELVRPYVPIEISEEILLKEPLYREALIKDIKKNCKAMSPVALNVNGETITFNGGDSSAGAISGAIELAQSLGESEVQIWDYKNKIHTFTLDIAFDIAKNIALKYRNAMLDRQNKLSELQDA